MERVLGHVDVDEMYLDVDPENLPDKGEIVETAHFFVGQAYNAHIHGRPGHCSLTIFISHSNELREISMMETERLILRKWKETDAESLFERTYRYDQA